MGWLNVDEAIFYGMCWCIGFLAAMFVTLDSASNEPLRKCFTVGGISGFLSFSVVSLCVGRVTGPLSGHWYYLGIATLIGLSAKQGEAIRQKMIDYILKIPDTRGGGGNVEK